jgi:hypothetical protein
MDELKKYLQDNRQQMDVDAPPGYLLKRIQKKTAVTSKGRLYSIFVRVCAAACIIAAMFFGVRLLSHKDNKGQTDVSSTTQPVETKKLPVIKIPDTLQQPEKTESEATVAQQKNKETKQQLPVAYQLLNSFEHNYNKLVSLQLKSIRSTPVYGESPDYFNGFKIRMRQIDEDEIVLKRQIKTIGLNDELLEQLINLYQQKINLLKNLQHEIGSMNNKIKENWQPADSISIYYINI